MSGLHTTADSYTFFFFNDTATTEIYTLSLHDALPISTTLACQRACKQLDRLDSQIVALKNRLEAIDRFAWPGLEPQVFPAPFVLAARWFRRHWYDPRHVVQAGAERIQRAWQTSGLAVDDTGSWASELVRVAREVLALYGADSPFLDFAQLHAEVLR